MSDVERRCTEATDGYVRDPVNCLADRLEAGRSLAPTTLYAGALVCCPQPGGCESRTVAGSGGNLIGLPNIPRGGCSRYRQWIQRTAITGCAVMTERPAPEHTDNALSSAPALKELPAIESAVAVPPVDEPGIRA